MPTFIDQMNRSIDLPYVPRRIVSLVPSQTELLFDLGLDEEVIGITKFCIHPIGKVKRKVQIGGTKQLNINLIKKLNPDLVIGNKEENERGQIEELMRHFPIWMSDISDLDYALDMIRKVGDVTDRNAEAAMLADKIGQQFNNLDIHRSGKRVAYFIWRKPYMVAGQGTFINDILGRCGFVNAFDIQRYPQLTPEEITTATADIVLLSSEPYPFGDKHLPEFESLFPHAKIKLVDGEMFSWYGSRLLRAPAYFRELISQLIGEIKN
ncbi:MAG: ABC transporter substrate-binding protein [Bacteroidetes bacterium]|nr:ABC transporter substrate-binding protein [Bacteroidota bacterium]